MGGMIAVNTGGADKARNGPHPPNVPGSVKQNFQATAAVKEDKPITTTAETNVETRMEINVFIFLPRF